MSDKVRGHCPACGRRSLFVGSGGYITCSISECQNPTALADTLEEPDNHRHIVTIRATDFVVRHPLTERAGNGMEECEVHRYMASLSGPPRMPGRYYADISDSGDLWFTTAQERQS